MIEPPYRRLPYPLDLGRTPTEIETVPIRRSGAILLHDVVALHAGRPPRHHVPTTRAASPGDPETSAARARIIVSNATTEVRGPAYTDPVLARHTACGYRSLSRTLSQCRPSCLGAAWPPGRPAPRSSSTSRSSAGERPRRPLRPRRHVGRPWLPSAPPTIALAGGRASAWAASTASARRLRVHPSAPRTVVLARRAAYFPQSDREPVELAPHRPGRPGDRMSRIAQVVA